MSAKKSVTLGRRVAESRVGYRWYTAGKLAGWRSEFMDIARKRKREGKCYAVRAAVATARKYHHEYMRELALAVQMGAP